MTKSFTRLLIPIIILFISSNVNAQWVKGVFTDTVTTYSQVFGVENFTVCNGNIFANAGSNGLYISTDSGTHWTSINIPNPNNLMNLYSSDKTLFIVDGNFYRSTNNGNTWELINFSSLTYFVYGPNYPNFTENAEIRMLINNSTDIFIGTDIGGIFHSTDAGLTWINSSDGLPASNSVVDPKAKTRINSLIFYGYNLLVDTENGIYISTDNGKLWQAVVNNGYNGLPLSPVVNVVKINALIANGSTIFASLDGPGIYRSDNSAVSWTKSSDNNHNFDEVTSFMKKDSIIFANSWFGLYRTKDNGTTWELINSQGSGGGNCPLTLFNSNIFASFTGTDISTDNGITWTSRNNGLGEMKTVFRYPHSVDSFGSIISLYTTDGISYLSTDFGTSWQRNVSISANLLNTINYNEANTLRLNGSFYNKNKDNKWVQIFGPTGPLIMVGSPGGMQPSFYTFDLIKADTFIIAATNNHGLCRTGINSINLLNPECDISNWQLLWNLEGYTFSINNDTVFLSTRNGIYKSTDFCMNWYQCGLSDYYVSKILSIGPNLLAYTNGGFFRSNDDSKTWNHINIGLDNIQSISLSGDNLFAVTYSNSSNGVLWKRPFNDIMTSINKEEKLPMNYSLSQNYPNPFNPSTVISYQIPKASHVLLKIYDVLGREISTLIDKEQVPGNYKVDFKGQLSSGIYFYRLTAGDFSQTKKMMLLK